MNKKCIQKGGGERHPLWWSVDKKSKEEGGPWLCGMQMKEKGKEESGPWLCGMQMKEKGKEEGGPETCPEQSRMG